MFVLIQTYLIATKAHPFLPLSTKVLTVSFGVAFGPTLLPLSTLGTKWEIFLGRDPPTGTNWSWCPVPMRSPPPLIQLHFSCPQFRFGFYWSVCPLQVESRGKTRKPTDRQAKTEKTVLFLMTDRLSLAPEPRGHVKINIKFGYQTANDHISRGCQRH